MIWESSKIQISARSPMMIMVLFWSGSITFPSWHDTKVLLRFSAAVTVAVDIMDVPGIATVTINWNGGSVITPPWLTGAKVRSMPRDETLHWCEVEEIVQVNVTRSPGHSVSTLDCSWAAETEAKMQMNRNSAWAFSGGQILTLLC